MQKGMSEEFKKENGAVSVFLLLIFLGLLMLAGLVVDVSRVMVAERKVQTALDTATRSVLAAYDEELVGQYGIYGVSFSPGQAEALKRYFVVNLAERHAGFRLLNFDLQNVQLTGQVENYLLNDEAFKYQIIEYMKYKGPVLVTQNIADIFLAGAFGKKADLLEKAGSTGTTLKDILSSREKMNEVIKNWLEDVAQDTLDKLLSMKTLEKGLKDLQDQLAEYEEGLKTQNERIKEIEAETKELLAELDGTEAVVEGGKFSLPPELEELKKQLHQQLQDIKHNQSLLEQINELEEERRELFFAKTEYSVAGDIEEVFRCDQKIEKCTAEIDRLNKQLRPLKELPAGTLADELPAGLKKENKEQKQFLLDRLAKFLGKSIAADNPVTQLIPETDFLAANQKTEHDGSQEELEQQMGMFAYDKEMSSWSKENAGEIQKNIFTVVSQLTATLKQLREAGVEKTYLTEYIMDKHTFITSPTKRGHYFSKGEVEYILCGESSERLNLLQAFTAVWGLRFALNAVDSFFTNLMPTFFSRLGTALLEGFIFATTDMVNMYSGLGAPLCPSLASATMPRLSYSDHLRLLLLMKKEKVVLDRIRQLMQINLRQSNTDFVLKDYGTMFISTAEVGIDLWFAPLLRLDKLGLEQVKGNQYIIKKTSVAEF